MLHPQNLSSPSLGFGPFHFQFEVFLVSGEGKPEDGKGPSHRRVFTGKRRQCRFHEWTAALRWDGPIALDRHAEQEQVATGRCFLITAQNPLYPQRRSLARGTPGRVFAVASQSDVCGQPAVSFPHSPRWHDFSLYHNRLLCDNFSVPLHP